MAAKVNERLVLHEWPGSRPKMHDLRSRPISDLPARQSRSKTPIDVFVEYEEALVELTHVLVTGAAHQEKAAHHPIDVLLSCVVGRSTGTLLWQHSEQRLHS